MQGEVEISHPLRHDKVARLYRNIGTERLLGLRKPLEPVGSECGQQAVCIAEMMGRRRMADPCPLGNLAQGELLYSGLDDLCLGGLKQRLLEIAMVVIFLAHDTRSTATS